jgi:hypothetical protein
MNEISCYVISSVRPPGIENMSDNHNRSTLLLEVDPTLLHSEYGEVDRRVLAGTVSGARPEIPCACEYTV